MVPPSNPSLLWYLSLLTPGQWLNLAAAIVCTALTWWIIKQADRIVEWLFPDNEFEHSLGWLNIRAQKRAEAGMRWIGYVIYATLAAALYGIVWAAEGFRDVGQWYGTDAGPMNAVDELFLRVPVFFVSFGIWIFYIGCGLLPRMHREREEREWAELQKFRAEQDQIDRDLPPEERSRLHKPLPKPRVNGPFQTVAPKPKMFESRRKRQDGPGG